MKTLQEAWDWYEAAQNSLKLMQRIGRRHWDSIAWDDPLMRDDKFRTLDKMEIEHQTATGLAPIDDLAVVVLFSVFESLVRDFVVRRIRPEASTLSDPILKHAADDAIQGVQEGSFFRRVLEPLKEQSHVAADLVTEVNQVRDYRNWVAHGKRERPTNNIAPKAAYERLKNFLDALGIAVESERPEDEPTVAEEAVEKERPPLSDRDTGSSSVASERPLS